MPPPRQLYSESPAVMPHAKTQSREDFLDCSHGSQEIKDFLLGIRRVGLRLGVAEGCVTEGPTQSRKAAKSFWIARMARKKSKTFY